MRRIVVYEHLCSGALAGQPEEAELLPLGRQIRDALAADLAAVPALALSVVESAAAPATMAGGLALRRQPGEPTGSLLQRLAASHDWVWVVAPESGGLLLQCHQAVGAAQWVGCEARAIETASRKSSTLAALARQGVCTPDDLAHHPSVTRWVVKPDDGAGAVATWRFDDWAQARAAAEARRQAGEQVVLQAWVEGQAMSLSLLCRAGRAELLSVNTQHIGVAANGQVHFDGVTAGPVQRDRAQHRALEHLADEVAQAIGGLRGFVSVDLVWHPQRGPVAIEVNPRVSCAYAGQSARLGRNLAAEILALHQPATRPRPEPCHAE